MKSAQAIFGAIVAALGFAAFVTFYDEFKPGTQNTAASKRGGTKGGFVDAGELDRA
jgi:hypothetical protein